jgi:GGDEF domain-containing protein
VAVDKVNAHIKKPYKIQYSVGQEHVPHDTKKSAEEMIQEADAAMYQHKENKDR